MPLNHLFIFYDVAKVTCIIFWTIIEMSLKISKLIVLRFLFVCLFVFCLFLFFWRGVTHLCGWILTDINPVGEYIPCRGVSSLSQNRYPGYDINRIWWRGYSSKELGIWSAFSLPLLPNQWLPGMEVPVNVSSMGYIDIFVNLYQIGILES